MWTARQVDAALVAGGYAKFDDESAGWYKEGDNRGLYTEDGFLLSVLKLHYKTPEELPRLIANDKLGERTFGNETWHHGIKPVLCILLENNNEV